jgi:myo-inositol-1(or 4)-monophosphatase
MEYVTGDRDAAVRTKDTKVDLVTDADTAAQAAVVEVLRDAYPDDAVVGEEGDELKSVPETGAAWVVDPIDGTTNFVYGLKTWATCVAGVVDGEPVAAAIHLPELGQRFEADDATVTLTDRGRTPDDGAAAASTVGVSDRTDLGTFVVSPTLRYTTTASDRARFAALTDALVSTVGDTRRLGCAQASLAYVASGALDAVVGPFPPAPWDTVAGAHMVELAGGTVTDLQGEPWRPDSDGIVASNGRAHDELVELVADALD